MKYLTFFFLPFLLCCSSAQEISKSLDDLDVDTKFQFEVDIHPESDPKILDHSPEIVTPLDS